MNDIKTIKKIFSLTHYDFMNNLHSWLSITGLHAIAYILIFGLICTFIGDFDISYWAWIANLFFDWKDKFYELFYCNQLHRLYLIELFGLNLFLLHFFLFPVVLFQNALDLAFDSSMRGMSIRSIPVNYIIGLTSALFFLLGFHELVNFFVMHGFIYLIYNKILLNDFFIYFAWGLQIFLYTYIFQLLYIFVLHLLEYKKTIFESVKEFDAMIVGKKFFLMKILILQILVTVTSLVVFYLFLGAIIKIIMPFFIWIFGLFSISVAPIFICMVYNFFYLWAYLLLFAWISLVTAHLYRQLVCPPIENIACSSCTSCEK